MGLIRPAAAIHMGVVSVAVCVWFYSCPQVTTERYVGRCTLNCNAAIGMMHSCAHPHNETPTDAKLDTADDNGDAEVSM